MIRIIIPAYNEEKNIKKCLINISSTLKKAKLKHQIYIVDDGSKDNTLETLKSLKDKLALTILEHSKNKGVSEAFKTGFKYLAKISKDSDVLILMEGDGTSDHGILVNIVNQIKKGSDVVICSRYVKGGKYENFPLKRSILSKSANILLKILFPIKGVNDYTIFYRGYKGWVIKKLIKKYKGNFIKTKHYVANSEILIKIATFTKNISEIGFVYNYGKKKNPSAMRILSNTKAYFRFFGQEWKNRFKIN